MLGDKIIIKPEYSELSRKILTLLGERLDIIGGPKVVLGIGGESGSGKSVTAICLEKELEKKGVKTLILHQDDYFFLPPITNHHRRLEDLNNVGVKEVDMAALQHQISLFLQNEAVSDAPLVDFANNRKMHRTINFKDVQVLIVEGTYVLTLENLDSRIFLTRDYKDTERRRLERNRDTHVEDRFGRQVLEIEHQIIRQHKKLASILVDKQYDVKLVA